MGNFENDEASRARKLAKRRKTNLILNSLITIVLLLIVFVTVKIFFGDGQSEAEKSDSVVVDKQLANEKADVDSGNKEEEVEEEKQDASDLEDESESDDEELEEESEPTITEGGSSPDVKQTIVNPDWKPVGTTQTGEHQTVYDESSVDWQEMLKALSYATGIDGGNMTVWFLGNNGGPQSAAGTVSDKTGGPKYRVAIEWVDGEGWKPVKVEELK
jgi:cytoskeletal protein RodZ